MNYEGKRSAQSPIYPPDLVNNLAVIDEAKALMGLAPEGCNQGLASCTGSNFGYLNGFLKTGDDDTGFARIDHQISQNNRLAFRYNVEDTRALGELVGNTLDGGGIGVPSGGSDLFIRDQSVVATLNSVLTPNVVNTVLAQYARRHYNFPGVTGQPDFSVLNDLELGHNFGTNDRLYETRVQLSESVSWVKGNHVAKFGADGNWLSSLENFPGFTPVRTLVPGITCLANFAEYYNTNFSATPAIPSAALTTAALGVRRTAGSWHCVYLCWCTAPTKSQLSKRSADRSQEQWDKPEHLDMGERLSAVTVLALQPPNRPRILGPFLSGPVAHHPQADAELRPAVGRRVRAWRIRESGLQRLAAPRWDCLLAG